MNEEKSVAIFLSQYDDKVYSNALILREILFANLPGIIEQTDISARMIAYCYGQKYTELICTILPSKKGLKLGFNHGVDLPDPYDLLNGSGKISRFIEIISPEQISSTEIKDLIVNALKAYKQRVGL